MRTLSILALLLATGCDTTIQPIAEGPQGEPGPAAECQPWRPSTYIVDDFVDVAPGEMANAQAMCDEGAMAMQGGCYWGDWREHPDGVSRIVDVLPYFSAPIGQAHLKHAFEGWQCEGENVGEVPTRINVVVVCLEIDTK